MPRKKNDPLSALPRPSNGLGWVLTLIAQLLAEFHLPLPYILDQLPLAQAFALYAAARARYGNDSDTPSYEELDWLDQYGPAAAQLLTSLKKHDP